jgi:hypothetical protein
MGAIADALTMLATKVDTPRPEPEPAPVAPAKPEPVQAAPIQATPVQSVPEQPAPIVNPEAFNTVSPQQPAAQPEPASEFSTPPAQVGGTVKPRQMQTTPRHSDPRAEEVAAQIRQSALQPPSMPEDDDEPRRRGLLGRLFNRD